MKAIAYLLRAGAIVSKESIIFAREKSRQEVVTLLDKATTMTVICSVRNLKRLRWCAIQSLPVELFRELSVMLFG